MNPTEPNDQPIASTPKSAATNSKWVKPELIELNDASVSGKAYFLQTETMIAGPS